MTKIVISALVCLGFMATAFADGVRPVETKDLKCRGKDQTGETVAFSILAKTAGPTVLAFEDGVQIANPGPLLVASEGNVYIQQVSNELKYNLYLEGNGLEKVLQGTLGPQKITLTGQIDLLGADKIYALKCQGTLN